MRRTVARLLEAKGDQVWTISPEATVLEALRLLSDKGIGALPVVDAGGGLAGIVSERDYARKVVLLGRESNSTRIREIMTEQVHTVDLNTSTSKCMELMTERRIRHLPVVEAGQLVGLISIGDVVRAVIEEQRFLIEQLESYITG